MHVLVCVHINAYMCFSGIVEYLLLDRYVCVCMFLYFLQVCVNVCISA